MSWEYGASPPGSAKIHVSDSSMQNSPTYPGGPSVYPQSPVGGYRDDEPAKDATGPAGRAELAVPIGGRSLAAARLRVILPPRVHSSLNCRSQARSTTRDLLAFQNITIGVTQYIFHSL